MGRTAVYPFLLLFTADILTDAGSSSSGDVEKHLEMGRRFLAQGQLQDALSHFHAAVEGDPENYMTYYTRATVYLGMGKSKAALPDLDKVIQLKPDFTSARMQRGSVLLKMGQLDRAHVDFEMVLRKEPDNEEAMNNYNVIDPLKRDIESAYYHIERHDYHSAIALLSSSIEICPWDANMRETRAESYIAIGDLMNAILDVRSTTKLISDNTAGYLKLSTLHYQLGETDESLKEIRECLKLDPDHKDCFAHYKKVKKLAKLMQDAQDAVNENRYEDCIQAASKALTVESEVPMVIFNVHDKLCHCYQRNNQPDESISSCTSALEIREESRILCERAESHIGNEMLDEALRDFRRANEMEDRCGREGMEKVQKLQKQAGRRDYYKILGVRRTASKREITKAFRKLAQKWHPDNYHGDEKKKAEKKFIDIAAAKEVLTNAEKRQKYDNGEDPLDPESQQGQGFNPFQNFHGSPFTFRFHFN